MSSAGPVDHIPTFFSLQNPLENSDDAGRAILG